MKHDTQTRDWLAVDAHTVEPSSTRAQHRRPKHTIFSAFAFNFGLVLFALASAAAFIIITRDHLYTYAYSDAGARVVAARVEKLNGSLIQLDFDRQQLWDDLIANELTPAHPDIAAARGFLLSARGMLDDGAARQLDHQLPANATDAQIEDAALDLLTPGTRARYEQAVPLLSRNGGALRENPTNYVAGPAEFQTMAESIVTEPDSDTLQFVLTGFRLNLAGVFTPRMAEGAAVLLDAKSRADYPAQFGDEISDLIEAALRTEPFRQAALTNSSGEEHAGDFATAGPAFTAALDAQHVAAAKVVLDKLGAMSVAASHSGATALISHAHSLRDLPRLLLIAEASRDRAAAAAKRLPRDGHLLNAARGDLTINGDLAIAISVAALAFLGMLFVLSMMGWRAANRAVSRLRNDDEYHDQDSELIDIGGVRGF